MFGSWGSIGLGVGLFAGINNAGIFKQQLTNISAVLNNTGDTTKLLTSFIALNDAQQKVLLSSKLLTEEQKMQCATMTTLSAVNTKYTAEQLAKATGVSAETLANWGLIESTDTLTISQLAELSSSDAQAKTVLNKIIAQNAQAAANGEVTASNVVLTASESEATLATGAFTTAIKANIKAMWTWMTTTPIGWLTMLAGAVGIVIGTYDLFTTSVEEQKEKMEESSSAYEDAKSKLSNIASELESQEQAMDDLLAKGNLTYAEKGQLEKLQAITKELRIQKDLAEKEEESTQKEVAKDASDLFNKQFGKYDISENAINEYLNNVVHNDSLVWDKNNVSSMIAGYIKFKEALNEAYYSKNQREIDNFEKITENLKNNIRDTTQTLQEQQSNIADYYNTIKNTPYDYLTTEQKEIVASYNSISDAIELIYQQLNPNAWKSMQIENVFDTEGIEKTKEELVEMVNAGTFDESILQSCPKLSKALEENKISAGELRNELEALADAQEDVQNSASLDKGVSSKMSMIESLQSMSEGFEILDKIYADIADGETFDYTNLNDTKFKETFQGLKEEYEAFIETVSSSPNDINACQSAFDNLISAWINGKDALKDLNAENKQIAVDMLTNMGIANAEALVNERLSASIMKTVAERNSLILAIGEEGLSYEELNDDIKLTEDEMNALIGIFPELQGQFKITDSGIYLEKEAYEKLKTSVLMLKDETLNAQKAQTQAVINETSARCKTYAIELTNIKSLASAYSAIYDNVMSGAIFSSHDYEDYLSMMEDDSRLQSISREQYQEIKDQTDQVVKLGKAYDNLKDIQIETSDPFYTGAEKTSDAMKKTSENAEKAKDSMDKAAETIEDANERIADAQDRIREIYEDLEELDKKRHLEQLQNSIEQCSLLTERLNSSIENLDTQLDLLDEDDYSNRADLVAQKLQLLTNKGAALKAEFERLSGITPISADEANEIASQIESIGSDLRSNLKDVVEFTKELQQLRVKELVDSYTTVDSDDISHLSEKFNAEMKSIERTMSALKGESLFSGVSLFSAIMPARPKKTDLQKQKDMHQAQINELQTYEDTILKIQQTALEMQDAENQKAYEKEKQDLYDSLQEQYEIIQEAQEDIRKAQEEHSEKMQGLQDNAEENSLQSQEEYNTESQSSQQMDHDAKTAESRAFADEEKAIVNDLNLFMDNNPIHAPALDESAWQSMVMTAQTYANQVRDIFNQISDAVSEAGNAVDGAVKSMNDGINGGSDGGANQSGTTGKDITDNAREKFSGSSGKTSKNSSVVDTARSLLGTKYVRGGTTPDGFDCSGYTQYSYAQNGIHIPRTAREQFESGEPVSKDDLQEGDLVFFKKNGVVHHVGIYNGNGEYLHAPQTGDVVKPSNLNSRKDYAGARRFTKGNSYAAGTPDGHTAAQELMLIGENYKNEIIGYNDGTQEVVNTPTIREKKDVDYVIGERDTEKISYAGGYSASQLGNMDIVTELPKLSEKQIESIIKNNFSSSSVINPSDAKGIYEAQSTSGISALAVLGIGALESGWGKYPIGNNIWGYGATNDNPTGNAHKYSEMPKAASEFSKEFKITYYDKRGATTINSIGTGNNPSGLGYAYNDDGSINTAWAGDVGKIMAKLLNSVDNSSSNNSSNNKNNNKKNSDSKKSGSENSENNAENAQPAREVRTIIVHKTSPSEDDLFDRNKNRKNPNTDYDKPILTTSTDAGTSDPRMVNDMETQFVSEILAKMQGRSSVKQYPFLMSNMSGNPLRLPPKEPDKETENAIPETEKEISDTAKNIISNDKDLFEILLANIREKKDLRDKVHEQAEELRKSLAEDERFSGIDTETWFDSVGNLTDDYYSCMENLLTQYGEEELQCVKDFVQQMSELKSSWISITEEIVKLSEGVDLYFIELMKYNDKYQERQKELNRYRELLTNTIDNPEEHSLNYKQALEFAENSYREQAMDWFDIQRQGIINQSNVLIEKLNKANEQYNTTAKLLAESYADGNIEQAQSLYEELQTKSQVLEDVKSEMENLDDYAKSITDTVVAYHQSVLDSDLSKYTLQMYYNERDLSRAEAAYSRQDRYKTQITSLKAVNEELLKQIDLYGELMNTAHTHAENLRKEYADVFRDFTFDDIEAMFTPDGTVIQNKYDAAIEMLSGDAKARMRFEEFMQSLIPAKKVYMEQQAAYEDLLEQKWNNERTLWKHNLDFALQTAENILSVHDTILTRLSREAGLIQRQLDYSTKYVDKLDAYKDLQDNYQEQITAAANKKVEADSNIMALYSKSRYSELLKLFDTSKWVDVNGELTGYYTNDLNNIDKINNKESYENAQEFAQLLSAWTKMSSNAEQAVNSASDSLKSAIDSAMHLQIDAANTAVNKTVSMIEDRKNRELKILDKVHEKRVEQLADEQEFIQKTYDHMTNFLDDVKSEEDYERQLSDEQETADKLQQRISNLSISELESDKMTVLELRKELNEQLKKIDDMKREHEYEQTKKALADDLELYNENISDMQEAEDDHYQYNQELIESRYSQENMYNEAIRILNKETFKDIQDSGIYTYEQIYNKGNQVSLDLTEAYDNFAAKTGEKFQNLGIDFENMMGLFENAAKAVEALESDAVDWAKGGTLYGETDSYDYDINYSHKDNNYGEKELHKSDLYNGSGSVNSGSVNSGGTSNNKFYTPKNNKEEDIISQMKANSREWHNSNDDEKNELNLRNTDLADSLGLTSDNYNKKDGRWYKDGLPLYHTGRLTETAEEFFEDILKKDEEPAIVLSSESIIPDEYLSDFLENVQMPSVNLLRNPITDSASKGLSAVNSISSNSSNSSNINMGDFVFNIEGAADKQILNEIESIMDKKVIRILKQNNAK